MSGQIFTLQILGYIFGFGFNGDKNVLAAWKNYRKNSFIPQSWINVNNHLREKEWLLMEILENKRALNFNLLTTLSLSPHQAA